MVASKAKLSVCADIIRGIGCEGNVMRRVHLPGTFRIPPPLCIASEWATRWATYLLSACFHPAVSASRDSGGLIDSP